MTPLKNWSGNLTYSTTNIYHPQTLHEIAEMVRSLDKLRVFGTRHCFNTIADSPSALLSTAKLNEIHSLDDSAATVTVGAGIRYGELCEYLHAQGWALPNLASLPHISIAGACATATHGSGVGNGNLATSVSAVELVTGTGDVISLSRKQDPELFPGVVVNLGTLGVVTRITLDLVPTFEIAQCVYLDLPIAELVSSFDEIMSAGYSVSLFTDWQGEFINQVWIKRRIGESIKRQADGNFFGARPAESDVHPIAGISAENCTPQLDQPGPWFDRLPHFRMGYTPSSGEELQAEYFVARQYAVAAFEALYDVRDAISPVLLISEIRTVAGDDLWLSPFYLQDTVAFHFTLKQDTDAVNALLPIIEHQLEPFEVKPHWGKLFTIPPSTLQRRYARMHDFRMLMKHFDPQEKFSNSFTDTNIT